MAQEKQSIPVWLMASFTIFIGISLGVWFAGESTRSLDEDLLVGNIKREINRSTELIAGLIANAVVANNKIETDIIIKQYLSGWNEITFVHVSSDDGMLFTEWHKKPVQFGDGILKFEAPILLGEENFGVLSVYADINNLYSAMDDHIQSSRRRAALILLSITMLIACLVNYVSEKQILAGKDDS